MLRDLILKNRSYRRFDGDHAIDVSTLRELVELAQCSGSGANRQPLKYILSCEPDKNAMIFPYLAWAGYLTDWPGPDETERPTAYIILVADTEISKNVGCDHGIAAQSILLGATEKGLGGCMIGSIRKPELQTALNLPPRYDIVLAIALGKPKETVVLETVGTDGDIKYWRSPDGMHHVPKRPLAELILDL